MYRFALRHIKEAVSHTASYMYDIFYPLLILYDLNQEMMIAVLSLILFI